MRIFDGDTYFPELNKEDWFESMNESLNQMIKININIHL
jgi:hypothetical protein